MSEGGERSVGKQEGVAGGCVYVEYEMVGCAFHHHVHGAADGIAFHGGRQRFDDFKTLQEFRREHVHGDEAVFVIGARYLDAVDEVGVVTLVHAADNGVSAFAGAGTLKRYAAYALEGRAYRYVGEEPDGVLREDVLDGVGIFFQPAGGLIGLSACSAGDDDFRQSPVRVLQEYVFCLGLAGGFDSDFGGFRVLVADEADVDRVCPGRQVFEDVGAVQSYEGRLVESLAVDGDGGAGQGFAGLEVEYPSVDRRG